MMLEGLLSTPIQEKILLFIQKNEKGYATQMSNEFKVPLVSVQNQLEKMERHHWLQFENIGRIKMYSLSSKNYLAEDIKKILKKISQGISKNTTRKITGALVKRGEPEKEFNDQFWSGISAEDKFSAAWDMVKEVNLFKGKPADESRLRRSVQNIKRRKS